MAEKSNSAMIETGAPGRLGDCGKPKELDIAHHDGTFNGLSIDKHLKGGRDKSTGGYGAGGGMGVGECAK